MELERRRPSGCCSASFAHRPGLGGPRCRSGNPKSYLHKVGALIESPAFYPQLSGKDNLLALARLGGIDSGVIPWVLERVGLLQRSSTRYRSYSLGMKQRLGIAAALLSSPDLLILDEPSNGLDPAGIVEMRDLIRSLADEGMTIFVSSHLLSEIEHICESPDHDQRRQDCLSRRSRHTASDARKRTGRSS